MSNLDKYIDAFVGTFEVDVEIAQKLKYQEIDAWDSVGHITLISEIEDAFDLDLEADDMFEIDTFDSAIKVLESKYNQRF